jgi:uncharacterized protein YndB with AHSA1/START domain
VERAILLDAEPERVWEAITEEALLCEWLADEVELDPREGGEIVCRYADGEERRGEVALVEEAERLAFEWRREGAEPSLVEIGVEAVAGGTVVTVRETGGFGPQLAAGAGSLWGARLGSLRLTLGRVVLAA